MWLLQIGSRAGFGDKLDKFYLYILFIDLLHNNNVIVTYVLLAWIITVTYSSSIAHKKRFPLSQSMAFKVIHWKQMELQHSSRIIKRFGGKNLTIQLELSIPLWIFYRKGVWVITNLWEGNYRSQATPENLTIKDEEKAHSFPRLANSLQTLRFLQQRFKSPSDDDSKSMVLCGLLTYIFHQSSSLAWPDHTEHAQHYSMSAKVCGSFPNAQASVWTV